MKNFKKVLALGMTAVMMMGSSLSAFAAEGDATEIPGEGYTGGGSGTEAYVNKEVYKINVPTGDALTKVFDFTVDPTGLVNETKGAEFGLTGDITDKGIFFKNKENGTLKGISNTSDALTIINKSAIGITLDVDVKMEAAGGGTDYAGGYSTTADFGHTLEAGAAKTADAAAGLFFEVIPSNDVKKALSGTSVTFKNACESAYDQYEVSYDSSAKTYKFELKDTVKDEDLPKYQFQVYGQLNYDAPATTWVAGTGDSKTAKVMPKITLKFTPAKIEDVIKANAVVDTASASIWVYKTTADPAASPFDGGFETKPSAIVINGKEVPAADINEIGSGCVVIEWADICKAWGFTDVSKMTDEESGAVYAGIKTIQVTIGSTVYYAEDFIN